MFRFLRNTLLGVAALACMTGARADPIGPTCANNSCFGGIYELVYQQITPTHYLIGLALDLRNTVGLAPGTVVESVAFKVTTENNIAAAFLLATNAPGSWGLVQLGTLNNGGCDAQSNAGFACITGGAAPIGSLYGFVFDVFAFNPGQWFLDDFTASIKVDFGPQNGQLVSENITLQPGVPTPNPQCIPGPCTNAVPEPGTLLLLGLGLAGLAFTRRRRT